MKLQYDVNLFNTTKIVLPSIDFSITGVGTIIIEKPDLSMFKEYKEYVKLFINGEEFKLDTMRFFVAPYLQLGKNNIQVSLIVELIDPQGNNFVKEV